MHIKHLGETAHACFLMFAQTWVPLRHCDLGQVAGQPIAPREGKQPGMSHDEGETWGQEDRGTGATTMSKAC